MDSIYVVPVLSEACDVRYAAFQCTSKVQGRLTRLRQRVRQVQEDHLPRLDYVVTADIEPVFYGALPDLWRPYVAAYDVRCLDDVLPASLRQALPAPNVDISACRLCADDECFWWLVWDKRGVRGRAGVVCFDLCI